MGFYEDMNKRSKEEKRKSAQQRGGFEDEGSRYSGKSVGGNAPRARGGAPYAQRPQEGRQGGERPYGRPGGERSNGNRPARPYAQRPQEGRQGGERPYGRQSAERSNGNRPARPYAQRPQEGRQGGERPYGSPSGERSGGNRPARPYAQHPQEVRQSTERPAQASFPGQGAGFRKQSGNFRFAKDAGQRYSDRGAGFRPRPYGEQQEARRQSTPAAHARPYAPRGGRPDEAYPGAEAYRYSAPAAYDSPANSDAADIVPNENLLSGRNPIREALKSGRDIEKLLVARGELSGSAREIVQMAKENHIPVQEVDRSRLDAITRNHQGMLAFASAYQYHTVEDMLALAKERGEAPFLVLLDGITDPHNLGAIIRTAECAGAHGVIVHERRAVGLTPAAVKASVGAVEYIPVARVTNLTNTLMELKAQNIWAFAADMEGEDYAKTDFSGPLALVIGAEGEGVSRRVLLSCDKRVALPIRGKLDSLNASVAAGVLLYAAMRAR